MNTLWKLASLALLAYWIVPVTLGQVEKKPDEINERLESIEERLGKLEVQISQVLRSGPLEQPQSAESRMDRLERRVTRLESGAGPVGYRPGGLSSTSTANLEGRLRALEREVARLRR